MRLPYTIQIPNFRPLLSASLGLLFFCAGASSAHAQQPPVTVRVEIAKRGAGNHAPTAADPSNVAVWLSPADGALATDVNASPRPAARIVQRNKEFEPHVLVIQAGTMVQFPNKDPFFHNVFSLFDGKRFDLGLYEAGSSKAVRFDRVGVSFLFCNIHEGMSAIVVAVDSPYFGLSDRAGRVTLRNVPDGRYVMHVWYERAKPEDLKLLDREVTISDSSRSLAKVQVTENPDFTLAHKNKYGQDYVPPPSGGYGPP